MFNIFILIQRRFTASLLDPTAWLQLLNPKPWLYLSRELTKATPVLIPTYLWLLNRVDIFHRAVDPREAIVHQLLAADVTLLLFFAYKTIRPFLPRTKSI